MHFFFSIRRLTSLPESTVVDSSGGMGNFSVIVGFYGNLLDGFIVKSVVGGSFSKDAKGLKSYVEISCYVLCPFIVTRVSSGRWAYLTT